MLQNYLLLLLYDFVVDSKLANELLYSLCVDNVNSIMVDDPMYKCITYNYQLDDTILPIEKSLIKHGIDRSNYLKNLLLIVALFSCST